MNGFPIPLFLGTGNGPLQLFVGWIWSSQFPLVVFRKKYSLDKLVQFVQVNIGKNWTAHPALRCSAERLGPLPFFQISSLKHMPDKPQEAVIMDVFTQDAHEHVMRQAPKTI